MILNSIPHCKESSLTCSPPATLVHYEVSFLLSGCRTLCRRRVVASRPRRECAPSGLSLLSSVDCFLCLVPGKYFSCSTTHLLAAPTLAFLFLIPDAMRLNNVSFNAELIVF
ncbi:uncharacterized protein BJX67DRAFT_366063 [Aspergillus lucknowensis]|uniref:Uncharacterized protein n=1 Tax=Aspergillus lucknowensis TaxID=176173 RepID=A0ABR4LDG8_9EURO